MSTTLCKALSSASEIPGYHTTMQCVKMAQWRMDSSSSWFRLFFLSILRKCSCCWAYLMIAVVLMAQESSSEMCAPSLTFRIKRVASIISNQIYFVSCCYVWLNRFSVIVLTDAVDYFMKFLWPDVSGHKTNHCFWQEATQGSLSPLVHTSSQLWN